MYTPTSDPIISTVDDEGLPIIFTKAKWEEKKIDHPELMDAKFVAGVQRAMECPEEVWEDYSDFYQGAHNKHCYYIKYSPYTYVKIVVWTTSSPKRVVSAYEVDYIKETKYPELTRLR